MAQRILKPLGYGEMLDEMFDIYKGNFVLLTGIAGVILIPLSICDRYLGSVRNLVQANHRFDLSSYMTIGAVALLGAFLRFIVTAAITWAVSNCYLGKQATIIGSYKAVFKQMIPFVLTSILTLLYMALGFAICFIPGLFISFGTMLVAEVFILENKRYIAAVRRSEALVWSEWAKVLVFWILTYLLVFLVAELCYWPFHISHGVSNVPMSDALSFIQGLATGIGQTFTISLQTTAFVLLYYDIRIRKEGFDIEMLAAGLENPSPSPK